MKLLRVLGEQTIERVGSSRPIKVDVRVVAATNKHLATMVEERKFREDLYWRMRVVTIHMPPLRDRKSDIPVLAEHFLRDMARANGKAFKPLGEDALPALMAYDWPGNVRELRTAIEHGVVMSNSSRVMLKHLPGYLSGQGVGAPRVQGHGSGSSSPPALLLPPDLSLEKMERRFIEEALKRTHNNRTDAADLLGLSRRTLQRKLAEMDMVRKRT